MSKIRAVTPWSPQDVSSTQYHACFATIGYEQRARYIAEELRPNALRRIGAAFPERQVLAFRKNYRWFKSAGFEDYFVPESDFEKWSGDMLGEIAKTAQGELRIALDISSMSRLRLASMIAGLLRLEFNGIITVDFMYSLAAYTPPAPEPEPIVNAGAVLPFFAGWSNRPELPTLAIVGLGYEPDKAVGAYEYLEASGIWAFVPKSIDPRYDRSVHEANSILLHRIPLAQRIAYRVDQPFHCFTTLESVVYGTLTDGRPVLLPFGPKIFTICALLVASLHRDVPVWRISSGQLGDAVDQTADGNIMGIRAVFADDDSTEWSSTEWDNIGADHSRKAVAGRPRGGESTEAGD